MEVSALDFICDFFGVDTDSIFGFLGTAQ